MRELIIGIVGVAVLSVIFGLVGRRAPPRPKGGCGGCALASVCDQRAEREAAARPAGDREECWVSADGERKPGTRP